MQSNKLIIVVTCVGPLYYNLRLKLSFIIVQGIFFQIIGVHYFGNTRAGNIPGRVLDVAPTIGPPTYELYVAGLRAPTTHARTRARTIWPEAIMLLILPIILFCISHYTAPIILSFLPIILNTENSENTYISGTPIYACAYYTNLRIIFMAKLPLQIFTARVGLRFAVTVVDARLSPLDRELRDLQAASSSTDVISPHTLRLFPHYSDSLTRLLFHFLCRHNRRRPTHHVPRVRV